MTPSEKDREQLAQCSVCKLCKHGKRTCEVYALIKKGRAYWENDTMYSSFVRGAIKSPGKCKNYQPKDGVLNGR